MFGYRTVRQGERVAVWDYRGRLRIVDGPRRMLLWRETVQPLPRFTAAADEYLVVDFQDGHSEHVRGPAAVWLDPVAHKKVRTEAALPVDANEAIVVYRRAGEQVDRRIVRGPAMFVPTEEEWLHPFRWHGADPRDARRKIPEALKFVKLRVIPDQLYFDVESVRTADDALLVVKLMVFFELADIETMLDQTHDPIADFINAVTADVIAFVGADPFEEFKKQTDRLNDLAAYANLVRRAERIGYKINKVVYRGYAASDKLQAMHDNAIEMRTGLKLEAETEDQAQALADLKLRRQAERAAQERELQRLQAEHQVGLERLAHEETLRSRAADGEQAVRARRDMNGVEIEHARAADAQRLEFLKMLQAMQVDLTRYLVAQYQNPDRLIRIDGDPKTQLHLHEKN
jgi:hypothetical protein